MSIIRITVGIVYRCDGHGGRTVCTSAECIAAIRLKGGSPRGIV